MQCQFQRLNQGLYPHLLRELRHITTSCRRQGRRSLTRGFEFGETFGGRGKGTVCTFMAGENDSYKADIEEASDCRNLRTSVPLVTGSDSKQSKIAMMVSSLLETKLVPDSHNDWNHALYFVSGDVLFMSNFNVSKPSNALTSVIIIHTLAFLTAFIPQMALFSCYYLVQGDIFLQLKKIDMVRQGT